MNCGGTVPHTEQPVWKHSEGKDRSRGFDGTVGGGRGTSRGRVWSPVRSHGVSLDSPIFVRIFVRPGRRNKIPPFLVRVSSIR